MKKNILFALAVILLAGVIAVTRVMTRTEGTTARVEITDAETITLPLDKDGTYDICEGYGWLSKEHDQAVCMPAGVVVSVEKGA